MPTKRHKPEEVVAKLRQVDVLLGQGKSVADAVRAIGVTQAGGWKSANVVLRYVENAVTRELNARRWERLGSK